MAINITVTAKHVYYYIHVLCECVFFEESSAKAHYTDPTEIRVWRVTQHTLFFQVILSEFFLCLFLDFRLSPWRIFGLFELGSVCGLDITDLGSQKSSLNSGYTCIYFYKKYNSVLKFKFPTVHIFFPKKLAGQISFVT